MLQERTCIECDRLFQGGPNAKKCPDCREIKKMTIKKAKIDITGERFGRLIAVKEVDKKGKERCWLCKCDCGNEKVIRMLSLRAGNTKSCGCLQTESEKGRSPRDISGKQFYFLTAVENTGDKINNSFVWLCRCVCGNTRKVTVNSLTQGHVKSCGCREEENRKQHLSQQLIKKLLLDIFETHGETTAQFLGQHLPFTLRTLYSHFPKMKLKDIWRMIEKEYKERSEPAHSKDLTGKRFGELTVLRISPDKLRKELAWICKCTCGEEIIVTNGQLIRGTKKSCGCLRKKSPPNMLDLTGKRFGKLIVLERNGRTKNGSALWLCACDCGETTTANATSLQRGNTTSCGCAKPDQIKNARKELENNKIDGVAVPLLTKKVRSDSTTGIKGVFKKVRKGKVTYEANITIKGNRKHLGTFSTIEKAIKARELAELEYHQPYIEKSKESKS